MTAFRDTAPCRLEQTNVSEVRTASVIREIGARIGNVLHGAVLLEKLTNSGSRD
jgi:hypothetical protein